MVRLAQVAERLVDEDPGQQRVDDDIVASRLDRFGPEKFERLARYPLDQWFPVAERREALGLPNESP